jgi:hypothetical protein
MLNLLEAYIEKGILSSRSSGHMEVVKSLYNIIEGGAVNITLMVTEIKPM